MDRQFLKPKAGLLVRDPISKLPLPPEGKEVVMNSHWYRRVGDGDVTVVLSGQGGTTVTEKAPSKAAAASK